MEKEIIIYHGSRNAIEKPVFGLGGAHNDYGLGFYCTVHEDLASEWACPSDQVGFANRYLLRTEDLSLLNLSSENMHVLNWLAILLENRDFVAAEGLPARAKKYILDNFLPEYRQYDVIIGYRADDSYFSFARAFLNGTISLNQLSRSMRLGNLGEQVVLKSRNAFEALEFQLAIPCAPEAWNVRRCMRNAQAKEAFRAVCMEDAGADAVYVLDIVRDNWRNDDARLR